MKYKELQQFSQEVFGNRACFSETYQRTRKGKREIVRKKKTNILASTLIGGAVGLSVPIALSTMMLASKRNQAALAQIIEKRPQEFFALRRQIRKGGREWVVAGAGYGALAGVVRRKREDLRDSNENFSKKSNTIANFSEREKDSWVKPIAIGAGIGAGLEGLNTGLQLTYPQNRAVVSQAVKNPSMRKPLLLQLGANVGRSSAIGAAGGLAVLASDKLGSVYTRIRNGRKEVVKKKKSALPLIAGVGSILGLGATVYVNRKRFIKPAATPTTRTVYEASDTINNKVKDLTRTSRNW